MQINIKVKLDMNIKINKVMKIKVKILMYMLEKVLINMLIEIKKMKFEINKCKREGMYYLPPPLS